MWYRSVQPSIGGTRNIDRIVVTWDQQGLKEINAPDVLAVILITEDRPVWIDELAADVRAGRLVVPRTILANATAYEIEMCVARRLDGAPVSSETKQALCEDLVKLVSTCAELTGSYKFRFRLFTDIPNCRCSFHVDTVPAGVPTTALIHVYCGARTEYVAPSSLTCWEDFYSYVYYRQQLVRRIGAARAQGDSGAEALAGARLARLEEQPPFLVQPGALETVPREGLVACKFVDSQYLWGGTHLRARSARGWIHRSPMVGEARLVATVNAVVPCERL
jgi:hypothetical protein